MATYRAPRRKVRVNEDGSVSEFFSDNDTGNTETKDDPAGKRKRTVSEAPTRWDVELLRDAIRRFDGLRIPVVVEPVFEAEFVDELMRLVREMERDGLFLESTTRDEQGREVVTRGTRASKTAAFPDEPYYTYGVMADDISERLLDALEIGDEQEGLLTELLVVKYEGTSDSFDVHHDSVTLEAIKPKVKLGPMPTDVVRVLTAFVYLNTVPEGAGGETVFPEVKSKVRPVAGNVSLFPDVRLVGDDQLEPREDTIHSARPLSQPGLVKYGLNFWVYARVLDADTGGASSSEDTSMSSLLDRQLVLDV